MSVVPPFPATYCTQKGRCDATEQLSLYAVPHTSCVGIATVRSYDLLTITTHSPFRVRAVCLMTCHESIAIASGSADTNQA